MAVIRKSDIRRFWLTAGVLLMAGCTAPAVVGHWVDHGTPNIRFEAPGSVALLSETGSTWGQEAQVEGPGRASGQENRSTSMRRTTFVAMGSGTAGSRIPDPEAPVR